MFPDVDMFSLISLVVSVTEDVFDAAKDGKVEVTEALNTLDEAAEFLRYVSKLSFVKDGSGSWAMLRASAAMCDSFHADLSDEAAKARESGGGDVDGAPDGVPDPGATVRSDEDAERLARKAAATADRDAQ